MKTPRCRAFPALTHLARGLSIYALLMAADGGNAWAGKPVEDGSTKPAPAPAATPSASKLRDSGPRDSAPRSVSLTAYDKAGKPAGHAEGFFVSSNGIVATVRHLLTQAARITGETSDGKHFAVSGILATDPIHDVVLLQTDAQKTAAFPRGDFQRSQVGMEVSIGNRGTPGKEAGGVIMRSDDLVQGYHWLLIKAIASEGMGGAPVFSEGGDLIGMIRSELKADAPGAAVSIESIDELLKRLPARPAVIPVADFKSRTYDELLDDPEFREALSAIERKDFLTAASNMSKAADQFPESAACRAFLGTFQTEMKSWPAAEKSYKAALKIDPDYALAWGYIGIPLYYQGKGDEAVAACKKSIALQRDNFGAWTNLGGIYIMQGNATAANKLIEELKEFHTREAYKIADRLSAGLENAAAAAAVKGAGK